MEASCRAPKSCKEVEIPQKCRAWAREQGYCRSESPDDPRSLVQRSIPGAMLGRRTIWLHPTTFQQLPAPRVPGPGGDSNIVPMPDVVDATADQPAGCQDTNNGSELALLREGCDSLSGPRGAFVNEYDRPTVKRFRAEAF